MGVSCSATRSASVPDSKRDTQVIETPKEGKESPKTPKPIKKKELIPNDFHIGFFLPFNLNNNLQPNTPNFQMFESVCDYYLGLMMAIEQLKQDGMNITLHVYDTRQDSTHLAGILRKPEIKDLDLVFGPLSPKAFAQASAFLEPLEIPMVSPFLLPEQSKISNPNSFYCSPNLEAYGLKAGLHVKNVPNAARILFFNDGTEVAKAFKRGFKLGTYGLDIPMVEYPIAEGLPSLDALLKKDSLLNIIIMPSDKEKEVNAALRSFKLAEEKGYLMQLYGLDTWLNFRDPELDHWHKLNAYLITNYYVQTEDSVYRNFYYQYRNLHQLPPSDYSLKGFDQMLFFGKALRGFGKAFPAHVRDTGFEGIGSDFYWMNNSSLIENRAVRVIQYQGFQFKIVR